MLCEIRWYRRVSLPTRKIPSMLVVKPVDELLWIVDCELVKGYSLSVLGAGDHIPEGVCISLETKEVFDEIIELAWDYPKDLEHFIFDWIEFKDNLVHGFF